MEEKIITEETEVLESAIPEELKKYLEADESSIEKIDGVLVELDNKINSLNNEKIESEKDFDQRLETFKENLAKEKEDAFNEFARREQEINDEKSRIESIKLDEKSKQANYVDSLKAISSDYSSKISSIEEAIKACDGNETLIKALEEEKNNLNEALEKIYNDRKQQLDNVLMDIGLKEEKVEPKVEEQPKVEVPVEEPIEKDLLKEQLNPVVEEKVDFSFEYDNEVISHEKREDVIKEIYESEDVMEGHVFPYLKSNME